MNVWDWLIRHQWWRRWSSAIFRSFFPPWSLLNGCSIPWSLCFCCLSKEKTCCWAQRVRFCWRGSGMSIRSDWPLRSVWMCCFPISSLCCPLSLRECWSMPLLIELLFAIDWSSACMFRWRSRFWPWSRSPLSSYRPSSRCLSTEPVPEWKQMHFFVVKIL